MLKIGVAYIEIMDTNIDITLGYQPGIITDKITPDGFPLVKFIEGVSRQANIHLVVPIKVSWLTNCLLLNPREVKFPRVNLDSSVRKCYYPVCKYDVMLPSNRDFRRHRWLYHKKRR